MRSTARIKSHPIHPMIIPFPLAFFIGTFLFDLGARLFDRPEWGTVAFYLAPAGVVFGLLAAIPGIIDYRNTIPPKSSAKKRAATHGLLNTGIILLFAAAWWYRQQADARLLLWLAAEGLGTGLLFVSGWMGATLVYRNQIGVDVRYGNAGKWNEGHQAVQDGRVEAASEEEVKVNAMKLLHVEGRRIVLARTPEGYAAFDDRCPHKGGPLSGGALMCGQVQCPWHGSQFEIRTGNVTAGPAEKGIPVYPVEVREGKVFIVVEQVGS